MCYYMQIKSIIKIIVYIFVSYSFYSHFLIVLTDSIVCKVTEIKHKVAIS